MCNFPFFFFLLDGANVWHRSTFLFRKKIRIAIIHLVYIYPLVVNNFGLRLMYFVCFPIITLCISMSDWSCQDLHVQGHWKLCWHILHRNTKLYMTRPSQEYQTVHTCIWLLEGSLLSNSFFPQLVPAVFTVGFVLLNL